MFSEEELRQIQAAFLGINRRNLELTRMVEHTWDALRWNGLTVVHAKRDGGGTGYDLANAPNDDDGSIDPSSQASAGT